MKLIRMNRAPNLIKEENEDADETDEEEENDNLEITQVIKDTHVTLSTVSQKTKVPVTSS
ncbi:hypothetical protein Tco_0651415, partial [Tanacetum coccineum]